MERKVTAPDGRVWRVKRRLRWPRRRDPDVDDFWGGDTLFWLGGDDFFVGGLIIGIVLFIVVGVLIVFVLPLVLFVLEALLAIAAVAVLRGTWVVEATTIGPPPDARAWKVRGWRRSRRAFDEVIQELHAGTEAEPAEGQPELR